MTVVRYHTADVFTDRPFTGNQLAVVPDARELTADQMAAIAREFNYSETTFVLPPLDPSHSRRVRIFTPGGELDFAGHPTVGTAHVLAAIGEIVLAGNSTRIVFEERVGPVPVEIRSERGVPVFCELSVAALPDSVPAPTDRVGLAQLVSLEDSDLDSRYEPESISCGTPFLFVAVRDLGALARARPRAELIDRTLAGYRTRMIMLFAAIPGERGRVRARMFAPGIGVPEDPATGSAAVGLGAYLARRGEHRDGTVRLHVEQGVEMGRPSELFVETDLENGEVAAVRVGGRSVMIAEGTMRVR